MKGIRNRRLLLVVGLLVLVTAAGITAVFAQEGEEAPVPEGDQEAPAPFGFFGNRSSGIHRFGPANNRGFGGSRFGGDLEGITPRNEALAGALDISLTELETAQAAVHANHIAEMVAAGYMDQEQADLILAYHALKGNINRVALVAEALGMSEEALIEAREEGTTLPEMLEDAELTIEEFMNAIQAAYEAAVQAEVGQSITQDQADQILSSGGGFGQRGSGFSKPGFGQGGRQHFGHRGHGMHGHSGTNRGSNPGGSGY